jgi:hypothetical protein
MHMRTGYYRCRHRRGSAAREGPRVSGVLADDAPIRLQESELDHYRFVESADLSSYLPPIISARVTAALRSRGTGATAYLPWSEPGPGRTG